MQNLAPGLLFAAIAGLAPPAASQLLLEDVSQETGLQSFGFGRGAAWSDFDGDGDLDLFVLRGTQPNLVFSQQPDHSFLETSAAWGVAPTLLNHWACVAADLDNDGDNEVFVGCGGFFGAEPNLLYRNDFSTGGAFVDASAAAGPATATASTVFGSTALDHDLDGDLDLFSCDVSWHDGVEPGHTWLMRNEGGLAFTDVSVPAGLSATGNYRMCGSADFDADGWPDLGVGEFGDDSRVYRNLGGGAFADVTASLGGGLADADQAFGMVFDDLDQDGDQDIYLPRYQQTINGVSGLYRNQGGQLVSDGPASGITGQLDMGHNVFDLDNDGWLELFIGTGSPLAAYPDLLFHVWPSGPGGALQVEDISLAAGITALGATRGHGSAVADHDGDGDLDLFCNNGGMGKVPTSQENSIFLRNAGNANGWIGARLEGVLSNRSAVGAVVSVQLSDGRVLSQHVSAGRGFGNTDDLARHFGLGPSATVERLDVRWPSGIRQSLLSPPVRMQHGLLETGLRLVGQPQLGSTPTLQFCGAPGHRVDVLWGLATGSIPLPKFGGYLQVLPPLNGPVALALDGSGRLDLPFPVPGDPLLAGLTLGLQAWIHAPGATSGPTLSNLLALTFF